MINGMENNIAVIITEALTIVRADATVSAIDAMRQASMGHSDASRTCAMELFETAMVRPETGLGRTFQDAILEQALRMAHKRLGITQQQGARAQEPTQRVGEKRMEEHMSENDSNTNTPSAPKASKRYNVGDSFATVATLGLKPTDAGRPASCGYQFSRKTGKEGVMDLPEGTEVTYVGAKAVYDSQPNSKRMLFKVAAGTRVILDGADTTLDQDILIAGVVNHIDPEDPYNIQARENEAKRQRKAQLKSDASAAKTKAA